MLTSEDIDLANRIVANTQSFIAGSYLIDPETANDIDIVISGDCYTQLIGITYDLVGGSSKYDGPGHELISSYRNGNVNVLVVKPDFIPAYKAAARDMRNDPELYPTRSDRIDLHQHYKRIIREMIDGPFQAACADFEALG